MKQILRNFWLPSLIALFASLLSWIGVVWLNLDSIIPKPHIITPQEEFMKFWDFRTKEIDNLAIQLQVANISIQKKEDQLKALENRASSETLELNRIKEEILRLQTELSKRILEVQASEQKNLKMLASTYSNMAPDAAIAIFKEMDDALIVKIMSFMSAEAIGPIFQAMANSTDKKANWTLRAAKLSEILRLNQTSKKNEGS